MPIRPGSHPHVRAHDVCPTIQETAQLEAEAFVQQQKVALASEVKAVLDSWVRFEQQEKENEQAELTKTVIANVLKSLQDEKVQKEILANAVAEIDRECHIISLERVAYALSSRARQEAGHLE